MPNTKPWLKELPNQDLDLRQEAFVQTGNGMEEFMAEHGYYRHNEYFLAKDPSTKRVVRFCHWATTLAVVSYLLGWKYPLAFEHGLGVPFTGISRVELCVEGDKALPKLWSFGDASHLLEHIDIYSRR